MFGVEQSRLDVIEMASARINLPCLRLAHSPYLDLTVVRSGNNEWKSRVKSGKIDSAIMTFEYILNSGEIVERVKCSRSAVRCVLAKARNVPDSHSLIL